MRSNLDRLSTPAKRTGDEKKRVEDWEKTTGAKLSLAARDLLVTTLKTQSDASEDIFSWVLYGWNARGDHNVVEMRNVQQAMQELINGGLAIQSGFKKEATYLVTGFKECQKDTQNLVHSLREVLTKRRDPEVVPIPKISTPTATPQKTPPQEKTVDKGKGIAESSSKRNLADDAARLMKKLARTPEEMKSICSPAVLYEVLIDIVKNMKPADWEELNNMNGILVMNDILIDEIENKTGKKEKKETK